MPLCCQVHCLQLTTLVHLFSLPQALNNYELTIALYLVFSRYGKVAVVKASRDSEQRPFGFVEFNTVVSCSTHCSQFHFISFFQAGCREAIDDNEGSGIVIGGRKVRLEMARNTSKLYIEFPEDQAVETHNSLISLSSAFKPISVPNSNAFIVKLDSSANIHEIISQLRSKHPDWIIQVRSDQSSPFLPNSTNYSVAESAQRQSGLFQLRVPESGVLPVAPATLAKINSFSTCLQYSVTPLQPTCPLLMNRLYEDWHHHGHEDSFQDPVAAREAANKLSPPLGDSEGDVFLGRLDNQKITVKLLLEMAQEHGKVLFLRLCNRSIIRDDRGNMHLID